METVFGVLKESWQVLNDSALYCLFGIFMSGLLKSLMPNDFVAGHLGGNSTASVIKASLIGMPLPLCSCGVIPVASGLRRQGAGTGATTAFLISTPETGIDSIALTYALLDPFMTVIRPVAAFITATAAGILVNCIPVPNHAEKAKPAGCSSGSCTCKKKFADDAAGPGKAEAPARSIRAGLSFAFGGLLADIGPSLLAGIVLAGGIAFFVPDGFVEQHLGAGIMPMLVMLMLGIPLYVCATASTPIVAALALKGLTPGAALVFLLAGPATNIATIMVVAKLMGKRIATVYVLVIASASLMMGMLVNKLYTLFSLSVTGWTAPAGQHGSAVPATAASIVLVALIIRSRLLQLRRTRSRR